MNNIISAPGILTIGAPTKDNGMRLRVETQELSDTDKLELIKYNNTFGNFLWKKNDFQDSDIPRGNVEDKNKTPAKRLRNCIYILHLQQGGTPETFEPVYMMEMEKLINQIKVRLD